MFGITEEDKKKKKKGGSPSQGGFGGGGVTVDDVNAIVNTQFGSDLTNLQAAIEANAANLAALEATAAAEEAEDEVEEAETDQEQGQQNSEITDNAAAALAAQAAAEAAANMASTNAGNIAALDTALAALTATVDAIPEDDDTDLEDRVSDLELSKVRSTFNDWINNNGALDITYPTTLTQVPVAVLEDFSSSTFQSYTDPVPPSFQGEKVRVLFRVQKDNSTNYGLLRLGRANNVSDFRFGTQTVEHLSTGNGPRPVLLDSTEDSESITYLVEFDNDNDNNRLSLFPAASANLGGNYDVSNTGILRVFCLETAYPYESLNTADNDSALEARIAAVEAQLPDDDTALAQAIADNAAALATEISDTDADVTALLASVAGNTTATAANTSGLAAAVARLAAVEAQLPDDDRPELVVGSSWGVDVDLSAALAPNDDNVPRIFAVTADVEFSMTGGNFVVRTDGRAFNATDTYTVPSGHVGYAYRVASGNIVIGHWSTRGPFKETAILPNPVGTQGTALVSAMSVDVDVPTAGLYKVSWSYEWSLNVATSDFVGTLLVGNDVVMTHRQEPQDIAGVGEVITNLDGGTLNTGTDQRQQHSGFALVDLPVGVETVDLQFANSIANNEAAIYRAYLIVERV